MNFAVAGRNLASDPRTFQSFALFQAGDAAACVGPIPYIQRCFDSVEFPRRHWAWIPPIKALSAIGLLTATRHPALARFTAFMLAVYFTLAVGAHVRVRDFGPNFASATAFLASYGILAAVGPRSTSATAGRRRRSHRT